MTKATSANTPPKILLQKIAKLDEATALVDSYCQDIDQILENDQVDQKLATLKPYLETMNSMAPDLDTIAPDIKKNLQQTITAFRVSLDKLLAATMQVKDQTINETQNLKSHNKSATAYIKASNGAGY